MTKMKTTPDQFRLLESEDDVSDFLMDASIIIGRLIEFDGYGTSFTSDTALDLVDGIRKYAMSRGRVTPKQQSAVANVNIAMDNIKQGRRTMEFYHWWRHKGSRTIPNYTGDGMGDGLDVDDIHGDFGDELAITGRDW